MSARRLERMQFRRKLNVFAWSHFRTENRFPLFLKMLRSAEYRAAAQKQQRGP